MTRTFIDDLADAPTVGELVATNVAQFREERHWTQAELARRLTMYGQGKPDRSLVAKIEGGHRQVTAEELVSLAFVLGVPPIALVVPRDNATMHVTPKTVMQAYRWMSGDQPAGGTEVGASFKPGDVASIEHARFYFEACPDFVWHAEHLLPGVRKLRTAAATVMAAAGKHAPYEKAQAKNKQARTTDRERLANTLVQLKRLRDDTEELIRRATRDLENGESS